MLDAVARPGPRFSEAGPRFSEAGPRFSEAGPRVSEAGPRFSEAGPRFSEAGPRFSGHHGLSRRGALQAGLICLPAAGAHGWVFYGLGCRGAPPCKPRTHPL